MIFFLQFKSQYFIWKKISDYFPQSEYFVKKVCPQPNKEDTKRKLEPGFGATIMIINGGIECGHGYEKPQATNRQKYYKAFAKYLKVRPYLFHKPLLIKCLKCSSKQLNIFTLIIKYVKCSGEHRGRGAELRPHEVFQQGGCRQSLHLLGPRVDQGVPVPAGRVLFLFSFHFFYFLFF